MSVQSSLAQLNRHARDLAHAWALARQHWHDANAQRFEREFIDPFIAHLRHGSTALQQLDSVLTRIQRDCS